MKTRLPKPGDVYAVKLPDGRFGAVRILRTIEKSFLVCTTKYLGDVPPEITNPLLLQAIERRSFNWKGQLAILWLSGSQPDNCTYLFNIPPSKEELEMVCSSSGRKWSDGYCEVAYIEWRWIHDRPALEIEMRKEMEQEELQRQLKKQRQKPKKMMELAEFWSLIEQLDWSREGDDKAVIQPVVKALSARPKKDMNSFEERLAFLLYQLDTKAHASNIGESSYDEDSDYISVDYFLYVRCAVVANGQSFYEAALKDPSNMPKDTDFEALLSVVPKAYELRTGEEFEYETGRSYETFSNVTGWK